MATLMFSLFQRACLLLVIAFALTRIPVFRKVLERHQSWALFLNGSFIFGMLGIVATQFDVEWTIFGPVQHGLVTHLSSSAMLIGPNLVTTVIAGLLGGPLVGLVSGTMIGGYVFSLGGYGLLANGLIHPLAGFFSGWVARFFSYERVISPIKALFVGMFIPILHMVLLLIVTNDNHESIQWVNQIGLPLVITNSVAIALFTAILRTAFFEQEQKAAMETQRALWIAEAALPFLRQTFHYDTAGKLAHLLMRELPIIAVSVSNHEKILAHLGEGSDHHRQDDVIHMQLALQALQTGQIQFTNNRDTHPCSHSDCPLQSAIIVPLRQSGEIMGLISLYFPHGRSIRAVEMELARGLGKLISQQLDVIAAERMKEIMQEARLRNMQAQVNPHFLFNTLNLIMALIRVNPDHARRVIVQLSQLMRHNLRIAVHSRILLAQELQHLEAYMEILKIRFEERLTIHLRADERAFQVLIPPCTLQPLVENSVKHGLANGGMIGCITVDIVTQGQQVIVRIEDNGSGIPPSLLGKIGQQPLDESIESGFGLYNVNQRLIGLFGSSSALSIQNLEHGGCCVSFRLPIISIQEGGAI